MKTALKTMVFRRSARARRLRIVVRSGGRVTVTMPRFVPRFVADAFVHRKSAWIKRAVEKVGAASVPSRKFGSAREFHARKQEALEFVRSRLNVINQRLGFSYGRVVIRNQKRRWGSCSRAGNLSFNYRLLLLPPDLADYVIAHELCHLKEMNHSRAFWRQLVLIMPNALELRHSLKRFDRQTN